MKILYPNRILDKIAESEADSYPLANISDGHPRKYWQGESTSAWVRLQGDARSCAVALAGCNATHIDIAVKRIISGVATISTGGYLVDENGDRLADESGNNLYESGGNLTDATAAFVSGGVVPGSFLWNHTTGAYTSVSAIIDETTLTMADNIFSTGDRYTVETVDAAPPYSVGPGGAKTWYELITGSGVDPSYNTADKYASYEYGYQQYPHNVVINLSAPENIHVGVVRVGSLLEFGSPLYGLEEGCRDYSIIKTLNNGSIYVKKRAISRTYSGKFRVESGVEFYAFMRDFAVINGSVPVFVWVAAREPIDRWLTFAMLDHPPKGAHNYYAQSDIDFSIVEVI